LNIKLQEGDPVVLVNEKKKEQRGKRTNRELEIIRNIKRRCEIRINQENMERGKRWRNK